MARTYTEHKLTHAMLKRLSKAQNGRNPAGTSTGALHNRGLVCQRWIAGKYICSVTEEGRAALVQARKEGW